MSGISETNQISPLGANRASYPQPAKSLEERINEAADKIILILPNEIVPARDPETGKLTETARNFAVILNAYEIAANFKKGNSKSLKALQSLYNKNKDVFSEYDLSGYNYGSWENIKTKAKNPEKFLQYFLSLQADKLGMKLKGAAVRSINGTSQKFIITLGPYLENTKFDVDSFLKSAINLEHIRQNPDLENHEASLTKTGKTGRTGREENLKEENHPDPWKDMFMGLLDKIETGGLKIKYLSIEYDPQGNQIIDIYYRDENGKEASVLNTVEVDEDSLLPMLNKDFAEICEEGVYKIFTKYAQIDEDGGLVFSSVIDYLY